MSGFPVQPEDFTAVWLSTVLQSPIEAVTVERVGTGQMAECYRLRLQQATADLPSTLIAKVAASDPAKRALVAGAYRTEERFYRELAHTVSLRVPRCFYSGAHENGDFILLLEDHTDGRVGDQLGGCSVDDLTAAAKNLAGLHVRWNDETLCDVENLAKQQTEDADLLGEFWGPTLDEFCKHFADHLESSHLDQLRQLTPLIAPWALARQDERFGLVHGDYRLDNLVFLPDGTVSALDWQTVSLGLPARDLAYVLGTSVEPDERRDCERDVVAAYWAALSETVRADYTLDQCWDDYRFAMVQVPLVVVFGAAYGERSERGDAMFLAMLKRGCAAMKDLDTLSLI